MKFEITGIGFPNKGAELMLRAAGDAIQEEFGMGTVVTSIPDRTSDIGYRGVGKNGYNLRFSLVIRGRDFGPAIARFLPKSFLRSYGAYAQHEIDWVFDASGLRYSDQWGEGTLKRSIRDYTRVKKNGGRIIILPQAFGPFEKPEVRRLIPQLVDLADLVYVRDGISLDLLTSVVGQQERIRLAPDFTALTSGCRPEDVDEFEGKVCVVPNARMLDMTSGSVAENYITLLREVVRRVHDVGLETFVLNHEGRGDDQLCCEFAESFDSPLPYTGERDALEVKGIIGSSTGLVTSRFHGLVSGLCQGVPSLTTSWNHKYEELCASYGTPGSIIDPAVGISGNADRIESWIEDIKNVKLTQKDLLQAHAIKQKTAIRAMWQEIFQHVRTAR
ncbi:MAG: polysaccharide pyruvyl transferase family protein [Opitutaceae bacterium]